jgi:FkbM family methyltransferase
MPPIRPDTPNALDWMTMYRDFLWIAHTRGDRVRFARAIAAMLWLGRSGRRYEVTFGALGRRFRCAVADGSELEVLRNIFVEEEYLIEPAAPIRTVVDLGSHVGLSVLWFHASFPEARIVAVEPHPVAFRRLRHNVGNLDRVTLVNTAVSDTRGPRTMYSSQETWAATLEHRAGFESATQVTCERLDDLLTALDIDTVDILKVDIEGAERPVLSTFASLGAVRTIICEYHADHNEGDVFSLLDALDGFTPAVVRGDSTRSVTFVAHRT